VDTTATLDFSCSGLVGLQPIIFCPNIGPGGAGGDGSGGRLLTGSGGNLSFQIYTDSGRTTVWGSTIDAGYGNPPTISATTSVLGNVSLQRTLYARVTLGGNVTPGSYSSAFAAQAFFWKNGGGSCNGLTSGTNAIPATFTFSVNVDAGCTVSATTMDFGSVGLLSAAKTASNTVSVRCTNTTPYTVGLGNGLNGTGPTDRKLAKSAERVTYGIYLDSGYTQPWGEVALGAGFVKSATGTGVTQPYTAYGRTPVQNTPSPGAYSDTVVTTITY
jgi:spore coat protein U-like protein